MEDIFLSEARVRDAAEMAALETRSAVYEQRTQELPEEMELAQLWQQRMHDHAHLVIAARQSDGTMLGFAALEAPFQRGFLRALYVEPAFFRRGVGRCLMEAICLQARVRGASVLQLEVERKNERAQAFYRALGFYPTVRQNVRHLLLLQKSLH